MAIKVENNNFEKIFSEFNENEITKENVAALVFSLHKQIETLTKKYNELEEKFNSLSKPIKKSKLGNFASSAAKNLSEQLTEEQLNKITGTGKDGKILIKDIKQFIPEKKTEKKICKGILAKTGDPCKRNGNKLAEDGNWYCHSHHAEFTMMKSGEISESDSEIESIEDGDILYQEEIEQN